MIDEMNAPEGQAGAANNPGVDPTGQAGFCQECGRGLTIATLRRVNNGTFCVPCASVMQAAQSSAQSSGAWQPVSPKYPGGIPYGTVPPAGSEPNPVLAGILGVIPGVGAMFNGQYAKGAMHLIVFVVLLTLADNLNWVFYWFVWGWIFYQGFDAYHTARARRDHLPLPNPFGWNDIGDRFGFNRASSSPTGPATPVDPVPTAGQARQPSGANWAGYVAPSAGTDWSGYMPTPGASHWAGYPPPPAPAEPPSPVTPQADPASQNPYAAPYASPHTPHTPPVHPPSASTPYVPTYTGHPYAPVIATPIVPSGARRFPVGALWLIVLGMLFLMGNLQPALRLSGRWLVPVLLAALSFWMAVRRWDAWRTTSVASTSLACSMTAPVMLLTVSFLLALQAGNLFSMHRSWPVLLVVWGALLLIQRSAAALHPLSSNIVEMPAPAPPPPVRSTSGTGSLGL